MIKPMKKSNQRWLPQQIDDLITDMVAHEGEQMLAAAGRTRGPDDNFSEADLAWLDAECRRKLGLATG